ncbi:serine O-acetyltransferase [Proteiniborus sp. DW1]|uniref:serine O-acetyltransferase n=1 Tax=Proteiniborus sp. DW1 TaxID=1889883 RepID=UPI00092E1C6D|nr:serine O-acetyltransferase [Proteiniborus sp. DW1]SCG84125.1 serine O-acetyltransferase [Proteiniborus sp. DW1]
MFKHLKADVKAVMERDPAAKSLLEVLLCYPGLHAIMFHRVSHWFYKRKLYFIARFISTIARFLTAIDIHPGAKIGEGVFIDHGIGVVIGETAEIGNNVTIYQGVTLGGTGKDVGKRHPTIGNNVVVSSGAKVLGPFRVGDNSKIGAGSVVLKEVPPNCTVVGVPGRVVVKENKRIPLAENCIDLDQIRLPDPVAQELESLRERINKLEEQVFKLTGRENNETL